MGKRRIDELIRENREKFYEREPPVFAWESLEKQLLAKQIPLNKWMISVSSAIKIAAATLLVSIGGLIYATNSIQVLISVHPPLHRKSPATEPVKESALNNKKRAELKKLKKEDPASYEFITDLNQLGEKYEHLRKRMQTSPTRTDIMNAMIMNLNTQVKALNQQSELVRQSGQSKSLKKDSSKVIKVTINAATGKVKRDTSANQESFESKQIFGTVLYKQDGSIITSPVNNAGKAMFFIDGKEVEESDVKKLKQDKIEQVYIVNQIIKPGNNSAQARTAAFMKQQLTAAEFKTIGMSQRLRNTAIVVVISKE